MISKIIAEDLITKVKKAIDNVFTGKIAAQKML